MLQQLNLLCRFMAIHRIVVRVCVCVSVSLCVCVCMRACVSVFNKTYKEIVRKALSKKV